MLVATRSELDLADAMRAVDEMTLEELEACDENTIDPEIPRSNSATSGGGSSTMQQFHDLTPEELAFAQAMMALDADNGALYDAMQAALEQSDAEIAERLLPSPRKQRTRTRMRRGLLGRPPARNSSLVLLVPAPLSPAKRRSSKVLLPADSKKTKLQLVCEELVATETRHGKSLTLLQQHFASRLSAAQSLELLPNLASLIDLSSMLHDGMAEAVKTHCDSALALALGRQLARIAPFFQLFAAYCAAFPATLAALSKMPSLDQIVAEAEAAIKAANDDDTQPFAIFALLIKPVQRLCQYPLLFREVVKAMPSGGSSGGGGGGGAAPTADSANQEAQNVLTLLDRAAVSVNERVRLAEVESEMNSAFGESDWRSRLAETCPDAVLALRLHLPVEFIAKQEKVKITRSLSFKRRKVYAAGRSGKLYFFSTALLLGKCDAGGGGAMRPMAVWSLAEVSVDVRDEASAAADDSTGAKSVIELKQQEEGDGSPGGVFSLRCDAADAAEVSDLLGRLERGVLARTQRASVG